MIMNRSKLKFFAALLVVAVVAGTSVYLIQQRIATRLRAENQRLLAVEQSLTAERDDALAAASGNADELKRREADKAELLRLRGEVGQLRREAKDAEQLAEQNRQLQEAFNKLAQKVAPPEDEPEADPERRFAIERVKQSKQLVLGLLLYASDNQDMLPTDLNSVSNYLGNVASDLLQNHPFELVLQGSLPNIPNPAATIAVRSQSPFVMKGNPVKVYGFADGHSEIKSEPTEGFETWEKQRMIPAAGR